MKKLLATLLASSMALTAMGGLVACGGGGEDTSHKITVWAPNETITAYQKYVNDETTGFKATYPDYKDFTIEFVAKGEGDVQGAMGTDPSAGAEVFFFASDHFGAMRMNNYLQPITDYKTEVTARDDAEAINFVTQEGTTYAFPATNDNGYFMWYDSVALKDVDITSLDAIQEYAKANGKHIMFDYSNSWYAPAFLIGMGVQLGYTDVEMKHYKAELDTKEAKAAVNAMVNYASAEKNGAKPAEGSTTDSRVITTGNLAEGLVKGQIVAGFSGTWEYSSIKEQVTKEGKNLADYKATAMPKFKATVDGQEKTYNMGTFYGPKYCGVNRAKSEAKIKCALALANFLTNEKGQEVRFDSQGAGPTNKKVAALDKVKASVALAGYNAQMATNANLIQGAQSDTFWGDSGIKSLSGNIFGQSYVLADSGSGKDTDVLKDLAALNTGLNT